MGSDIAATYGDDDQCHRCMLDCYNQLGRLYTSAGQANAWRLFLTNSSAFAQQLASDAVTPTALQMQKYSVSSLYIGVTLAVLSTVLIGASFIIKKKALIKVAQQGVRAGDGGYEYLREWMWWVGMVSMAVGEAANFVAYAFAPATLVTPLGALSVIIGTLLSAKFLKERLNLIGKVGCVLCLIGSTSIVMHAPGEGNVESLDNFFGLVKQPGFVAYVVLVTAASVYLIFYVQPEVGQEKVTVPIAICSLIGSFSVIGVKALGIGFRATFSGQRNEFLNPLLYIFLIVVVVCVTTQLNYLNRALDIFNTAIVTPIYYVFFTGCVLIGSTILFQDWRTLGFQDMSMIMLAFGSICLGIVLLNTFRFLPLTTKDISWEVLLHGDRAENLTVTMADLLQRNERPAAMRHLDSDSINNAPGDVATNEHRPIDRSDGTTSPHAQRGAMESHHRAMRGYGTPTPGDASQPRRLPSGSQNASSRLLIDVAHSADDHKISRDDDVQLFLASGRGRNQSATSGD